jgi:hypothetical protein
VFNLGLGELTVIALLMLIWAGPARLPERREAFVDRRRRAPADRPRNDGGWTLTEWLLVAATTALAATLIALLQR